MSLLDGLNPDETDEATAHTDMLLHDVAKGDETPESLAELQEYLARLYASWNKDPETDPLYAAVVTTRYILSQGGQHEGT